MPTTTAIAGLALAAGTAQEPSAAVTPPTAIAGLAHATGIAVIASAGTPAGPAVVTSAAASVTGNSATLNGTVNPEGLPATYQFQYGLTTAYGSLAPAFQQSAGSGNVALAYGFALSGLSPGTTYHYRIAASSPAGTAHGSDQQFTTTSVTGGVTFPGRPPNPLGLKVELDLAGTWTDITLYVLQRDLLQITSMGRTDEATTIQSGQLALTLRNTDGRFTPNNAAGAYYPNIVLNAQVRVSVNVTSATSTTYNGYRFYGEVSSWPPTSNPVAAEDIYIQVIASGIWRRISNMSVTIGSAYARYVSLLSGTSAPVAFWPMEDGSGSTSFVLGAGSGTALVPSTPPDFATDGTSFAGSDSLPQFNASRLTGTVTGGGTPAAISVRFALSVPAGGDSLTTTFTDGGGLLDVLMPDGSKLKHFGVSLEQNSTLLIQGFNATSGGTLLFSGTIPAPVAGVPVLVSMELANSGGSVTWALRVIAPGAGAVLSQVSGTLASAALGPVTQVLPDNQGRVSNTTFGQLGVFYSVPPLVTAAAALGGWNGEYAVTRFQRLAAEFFIPAEVIGSTSAQMGPQVDDTLPNLLQVIENTDGGLLYETQNQFGLGYRTLISMQNQSPAATINYAAGQLGAQLTPTYDDQLTVNQWTVTNWDGYTVLATLISGARSVQPVPEGVGLYSGGPLNISAYTDTQANSIAQQKLYLGTVNDLRYPTVAVNFLRAKAAPLLPPVPQLRVGDFLQVSNLPSFFGGGTASQLVWGWTETLSAVAWTITFNTVPEIPFTSGYSPGAVTIVQQPSGSVSSGSQSGSSTAVNTAALSAQVAELAAQAASATLTARSIGGVTSYIAETAPYDWSFTVTGSPPPVDSTSFTCTAAQAVPISAGDTFTSSGGFGGPFTVTALAPPANGNVSVYFTPAASSIMSSGTVYGGKNGDTWVNTGAGNQIEQWQAGQWQAVQFGPQALSFTAGGAKVTIAATAPGSPAVGDLWYDTSNGYRMNQWNGSAWVPYQYGPAAVSITSAEIGGVTIFVQTAAPTANNTGDLWYKGPDATGGYSLYQWNGSAWVSYQFGTPSVSFTAAGIAGVNVFSAPPTPYDWTFSPVSGTTGTFVTLASYATGSTPMSVGDTFTNSAGRGGPFTITAISAPSGADVTVTFTPTAGSPFTSGDTLTGGTPNDLWFNTSNGNALSVWSAGAWVAASFGTGAIAASSITAAQIAAGTITASLIAAGTITATQMAAGTITASQIAAGTITAANIQAGTITASQIAAGTIIASNIQAGTITATLLQAGIVVSGIVDATMVQASSYIATAVKGEFLAYSSSSPGSGTLINSIAGAAGTDGSGNSYPQGLYSSQLTLATLSSPPTPFSGASIFFSYLGRPRYVSELGEDSVIWRGAINTANFSVGNTTAPTTISGQAIFRGAPVLNNNTAVEITIYGAYHTGAGLTSGRLSRCLLTAPSSVTRLRSPA